MPDVTFGNLFAVALIALAAPLLLGFVLPVLVDAGEVDGDTGQTTVAASSVADFAAVVLLSLLFSTSGGTTGSRLVLLAAFVALVATVGLAAWLAGRWARLSAVLSRPQDTTAGVPGPAAVAVPVAVVAP